MTDRAWHILMWGVVNCTTTAGLFLVLLNCQTNWVIVPWLAFLWGVTLHSGISAFMLTDVDLEEAMVHVKSVPYFLEFQHDVGWIAVLYATGHWYTAWAWFMQMIALAVCYRKIRRKRECLHFFQ
jgi:hypothetical protein